MSLGRAARLAFYVIVLCLAHFEATYAAQLDAPSSLVATAVSSSQINLVWLDNSASENRFAIERSLDPTTDFAHIATVSRNVTSYSDLALAPATTFYYRVRAIGPGGALSPYSIVTSATTAGLSDTSPPFVPAGLTATAFSCSQVNLSWTASTDTGGSGLAGYKVFRGGVQIGTTTSTSYSNTGLSASTAYSFTVASYDNAGNTSAQSTAASATTPACPDTTAPSVPSGLTATAFSCSQVNLSWTASTDTGGSGLAGYKIFRGGVQIGTTTSTSYSNTGLAASTSYSFTIAAYDNAGNTSAQSTAASATTPACPDTTAPSVPSGLTATASSCSQVNLSWTASTDTGGSGLAGYKVLRDGVQVATTTSTSYSNTGLSASTSYSYTVAAYDTAGNTSAPSAAASATTPACPDTTAPSVPSGLTATAFSCSQVNLSWTASTDTGGSGLAGYKVFRGGVQIGTTTSTSYSNTGLSASTSYSFTVAAYDTAGNTSAQSAAASATTPACPDTTAPSVPSGLTATAFSCSQVNLSWTASTDTGGSGLAGYKIFRGGVQIGTTTSTSYSNTGLSASTSYSFTVAAYDNAGNTSAQSTAASATTPACPDTTAPSVPSGLTATAFSCSQVNLSWTASTDTGGSGLAGYKVFRGGVQIGTTASTSYSNTGLSASTSYSFTVAAYDTAGNTSAQSAVASATTPACSDTTAPSVPSGLTATASSCSQVNLSWTASTDTGGSGLAGYKVLRDGVQVATTTSTSYSNTGLSASTSYSYTVAAYDTAGNTSAPSAAASATTPACPDTTAPSVPSGLTATAFSCSQVNLSWTASTDTGGSGLAGYKIFRGGVQIGTTTSTSYSNTGLSASTSYSFTVAAYDTAGNTSAQSAAASATTPACPDTTAPSVPSGLTATAFSCSQVNLSWTASTDTGGSGLAGYKIFRGGVQIGTTTSTSYSNTGLSASTSYSFTVAAYDNAGNTSAQSTAASATTPACPDTTAPSVPSGLTATAFSCSQVNLSWTASTDTGGSGLAGYKVFRGGVQIGTTASTSYSNTGLSASTSYSFTVAAYDTAGNTSAQSAAASATTPACPDTTAPSVPSGLTATAFSCSQVNLSWTASTDTGGSGLAGYKIFRDGVQVATTISTSYSNTGLSASTAYSFTIAAYDNAGNTSAQSAVASATTPACSDTTAPSVPSGLTATAFSCSQVNLSWTASTDTGGSGLAGYKIFRGGVQIGTTTSTSYSNTGLSASTSYSFTVAAYDTAGNTSAQSAAASATTPACPDTTAPSVPSGLTATAFSCSQVNLSWTASTDTGGSGLTGYKIFRGGVQIGTTASTSYSNTGLSASTSYSFTVAAYDNAGNTSAQSTAASATTPACPDTTAPSVPSGLTATAFSCSQVNLSWTASTDTGGSGLAGYKIFRGGVQIGTTTSTSYSNTGLSASTAYSFTIAAYDNAGNTSAQSTAASATTPACPDTTAPSVPSGLTATAFSCSQVNLSWTTSTDTGGSGLAGYKIFRGGVQIGTTTSTSYSNTGLSASTAYSFTVAAYDTAGNTSAQSTAASATTPACPDTTAPSVPSGLTATAFSCSQVNLSWTASTDTGGSGLAGYKVFRGGVQIGTTTSTSYSNTGLSASTSYSYTVAAYDTAGNTSAPSAAASATTPACPDTTAPSVPSGLTATAFSCSQVNLSWTASTDTGGSGLAGYKVFRGGVQIGTTTSTSYSNTGLSASTSYSFTVAAYDTAGNTSAPSAAASATTPACPDTTAPSVPSGLTATAFSCSQVNLSWTASTDTGGSGLAGYKVFRGGVQIGTTTSTSYSNTGLSASTSYSFTVAAYDTAGNTSAQSAAASATTPACPDTTAPSVPSGLTATAFSCSQVNLSWTASTDTGGSGLAGYKIFRGGVQIGTTTSTSYSNTGLSASTSYSFTVAAYDNAGNTSAQSTAASATTPACPDTTAPSVPSGLTATAFSCSQVNLSWTASTDTGGSGLAGYKVFRGGVQIGTTASTSYSNTGLSASTSYSFTVAAYDTAGNTSAQSTATSATTPACPDTTAPSVPSGLTATAFSCSQVNLSWTASTDTGGSGLAGYKIFRGGVQIGTTTSTSYSNTGLSASTSYSFTVAAYDTAGNTSAQSTAASATTPACPDTTAPSVPSGLTATAFSCSQVNLSWTASTDTGGSGLAGYKIFRGGVQVATTTLTSFSNTGLLGSTSYSFTVAAYDNAGNTSAQSTAASATTPACPDTTAPSVPSGLTAIASSCSQVNLSWTASTDTGGSGLAGYKVFRGGVQVGTTTSASYGNTGLAASTSYSYTVAAYDNAGNTSAQSTAASTTTPACGNQSPVANAGPDLSTTVSASVTLNASGSSDPDGTITAYAWNFGDGGTASGAIVTHTYLALGTYVVTLTVTDNLGAMGSDTASISVSAAIIPGQHQWSVGFSGTTSLDSAVAADSAVDVGDDIVVIGSFSGRVNFGGGPLTSAGDSDIFLVKYSKSGAYLWSKRLGGPNTDSGTSVAVDSNGNIVVTGSFSGTVDFGGGALISAGNTDIFLAKYSATGVHLWSKRFGGTGLESGNGTAVDASGNILLTGGFGYFGGPVDFGGGALTSAGYYDIFIAKYSAAGAHLWSQRFGGTLNDMGLAIAVDSGANVVATGYFAGAVGFGGSSLTSAGGIDIFIAKYSPAGVHSWSKRFGDVSDDRGVALAIDRNDNLVVGGSFYGTVDFGGGSRVSGAGGDMFVAKFSATGTHQWSKNFGQDINSNTLSGLAVDAGGNVLMTGSIVTSVDFGAGRLWGNGSYDIFVAKFSSSGTCLWSKRYGDLYDDHGNSVMVDASGNLVVTGDYYLPVNFGGVNLLSSGNRNGFLVKFGP